MNFCTFWRLIFTKLTKFTAPKMVKLTVFALLEFTKLISHKIWMIEKSWNFHTVMYLCVSACHWCMLRITIITLHDCLIAINWITYWRGHFTATSHTWPTTLQPSRLACSPKRIILYIWMKPWSIDLNFASIFITLNTKNSFQQNFETAIWHF